MLAKRHLVALAFAGGCLSGATAVGIWHDAKPAPRDAALARAAARPPELAFMDPIARVPQATAVADDDQDGTDDEPVVPQKTADTDTGNSIAEILLRLEAAYRLGAIAAQPQSATTSPMPLAPEPTAHQVTAVAVVTPPAPPTPAPVAEMPPPRTAPIDTGTDDAPQRVASRDEVQPRDVYNERVQQNTNVASAHQGDVYYIQNSVPYFPYYAVPNMSRYGAPARRAPANPAGSGSFDYPIDGVFKYPLELVH
jgi:hypothetical protein